MDARLWVHPVSKELDAMFEGLPRTLNVSDAADLLGVSRPTLYKWLNEGAVPGYRVSKVWFILRDELKATLEAGWNLRPGSDTGGADEKPDDPDGTEPDK
ncbi:helix-turn-helix domain-containing protein [Propionibacterium sp.]|uniref:helix-turn-helix domain-containing protein n=1 Tax=Propionibacterium sp. TaxID=1977903 RepID=UPI0039EA43C2